MFRKIMVPLDRTRFAEAALPPAMQLAALHGSELLLVTVWHHLSMLGDDDSPAARELWRWEESCREADVEYMTAVARTVEAATGRAPAVRYLLGEPDFELANLAASGEVDLVVVSTHARGLLSRTLLRSVTGRLARRGGVPLLLIRPTEPSSASVPSRGEPFRNVLVPLDGSPWSEAALNPSFLAGLEPRASELTLLHVLPPPGRTDGLELTSAQEYARVQPGAGASAERYLGEVAQDLSSRGYRVKTSVITSSSTARAIVDFAGSHGTDLIAMATHGRGGIARVLLGSVAGNVVRTSHVPTLLFPPDPRGAEREATRGALVTW